MKRLIYFLQEPAYALRVIMVMKICLLVPYYNDYILSLASRFTSSLVEAQRDCGATAY